MSKPPSRVVFVGNIPYGLSEEQISDIFSSAGKVLNFRLVYDRETGKPKGFGFAEYPDADSASSAVRNLNDFEILGRKLRVDFSNEPGTVDVDSAAHTSGSASYGTNGTHSSHSSSLPTLPPGKELPPGVTCTDAISRTLTTLPPSQLLDILTQLRTLSTSEPQRAAELLQQAPQLSYAVFQALLLMGLVSPESIHAVIEPGGVLPIPPPVAAPPTAFPPAVVPGYGAPHNNTPPVNVAAYAPPTVQAPPAVYGAPAPAPVVPEQNPEELMRAVMELPQHVIDQLPAAERAQILQLRATFAAQRQ